jgi:hypothetical protein
MRFLALLMFVAATVAPAAAQAPGGMGAMQYYVGAWACTGGAPGEQPSNATATYTIENGILRDSVVVSQQGKMTAPYQLIILTTFDAKNNRYVQTQLDTQPSWSVSFAKPFTGNTEEWSDNVTYDGKLGHAQVVRTDHNTFTINGYFTMSEAKPDFSVTCRRS